MLKHVTFLGASVFIAFSAASAVAQDVTAQTVVATVGDTDITVGELITARQALPEQYAQLPNNVLFDGLIEQMIQQQLLADTLTDVPATITYALNNERRGLLASAVVAQITDTDITEGNIVATYAARFADAEEAPEFRASHLLVATQEEAAAAKTRIDEGASFADVARSVSTGPTGPNGGDLGWFGAGAMVPEFENQITSLEIGGVSEPFETQFGWHVATLVEKRVQPRPTLEELRPEITAQLQEAAVTARLEELAAGQTVIKPEIGQFNPDIIDQLELLD